MNNIEYKHYSLLSSQIKQPILQQLCQQQSINDQRQQDILFFTLNKNNHPRNRNNKVRDIQLMFGDYGNTKNNSQNNIGNKQRYSKYKINDGINQNISPNIYHDQCIQQIGKQVNSSSYKQLLNICHNYRKQNRTLTFRISQLQNTIKLITQSSHKPNNNINTYTNTNTNTNTYKTPIITHQQNIPYQYINRIKHLQHEYKIYKQNIYKQYKNKLKDINITVKYLILCYCQYIQSKDMQTNTNKFKQIITKIMQSGINSIIDDDKIRQSLKYLCKNTCDNKCNTTMIGKQQNKNNNINFLSQYMNANISNILQHKQNKILRNKIHKLTQITNLLINICRNDIRQLKLQSKGHTSNILFQLENTIVNNCNRILNCNTTFMANQNNDIKFVANNMQNSVGNKDQQYASRKVSKENNKISKQKDRSIQIKRMSMGSSIQVNYMRKPPLPNNTGFISNKNQKINQTVNISRINNSLHIPSTFSGQTPKNMNRHSNVKINEKSQSKQQNNLILKSKSKKKNS